MVMRHRDVFVGMAIHRILEDPRTYAAQKIPGSKNVYLINECFTLDVRYSTSENKPWHFAISGIEHKDGNEFSSDFAALVCSYEEICLLDSLEIAKLIPDNKKDHTISVTFEDNTWLLVRGPRGAEPLRVPRNRYPKGLLSHPIEGREEFLWPSLSRLTIYEEDPHRVMMNVSRDFDLADYFHPALRNGEWIVRYLSVQTPDPSWDFRNPDHLRIIENHIRYDLKFDGISVQLKRIPKSRITPNGFLWRLRMKVRTT